MNKLIEAAKAVIDEWDSNALFLTPSITKLRAAIERAEKPPAGFEEWADNNNLSEYGKACSRKAWQDAQHAERERCREIVITMGWPDVPALLRQIDSGED